MRRLLAAALAASVFALASGVAGARTVNVCRTAGVSLAAAEKAYGAKARIVSEVPNTCQVVVFVKRGAKLVHNALVNVNFFPASEWATLASQTRQVAVRVVVLPTLGSRADLFDIAKAPFFYEEEIAFRSRASVIVITPQVAVTATAPPRVPAVSVATLARQIHGTLG